MHTGNGRVVELLLEDGYRYARVSCPESLIPGPGQYLLASRSPHALLPDPIFYTDSAPQGVSSVGEPWRQFISTAPSSWNPGDALFLRGPLGRGFSLPSSARRVGLVAFDGSPARLRGLIQPALRQNASVVLLCDATPDRLADEVEIQPLSALEDILDWADFFALDVQRDHLPVLRERLGARTRLPVPGGVQILIRTSTPCGGVAECGVCAVTTESGWRMVCRDGPVFDLGEI